MPFGASRGKGREWWRGSAYMAVKEFDDGERESSRDEPVRESVVHARYPTIQRMSSLWRAMLNALLLASAMFVAAFLGTGSAIVASKASGLHPQRRSAQSVESPMRLTKGTRIPFLENGMSTLDVDRTTRAQCPFAVPSKPSNFTPHEILGLPATIESDKAWNALIGRK